MTPYRRITFILLNVPILIWLFKALLFYDGDGDGTGMFIVIMVIFLLLNACYSVGLVRYCRHSEPEGSGDKVTFLLLALLPFIVMWYWVKFS